MAKTIYLFGIISIGVGLAFALLGVLAVSAEGAPQDRVLTSITVNTLEDEDNADGDCSLREAIHAANDNIPVDGCPSGDAIVTDMITFLASGTISLSNELEVNAGGPMVIDGGESITVSGNENGRVLTINTNADITLLNLTISGGHVVFPAHGGGINNNGNLTITNTTLSNNSAGRGGGISNSATLTIINSILSENNASGSVDEDGRGGGIYNYDIGTLAIISSTLSGNDAGLGGGISNEGTLSIQNSLIADNNAYGFYSGMGGGIDNTSILTITNSTLANNNAALGGAIFNFGRLTILNSSLADNSAIYSGGGYFNSGAIAAKNTIVANSISGGDCFQPSPDEGHNLDSDNTCGLDPTKGSLPNTDPLLGPLQDNGGPTLTYTLLANSPAIDAGDPDHCPSTDQRGISRPLDGNGDGLAICDMGSYEYEPGPVRFTTTTTITTHLPNPSLPGQPVIVSFTVTSSGGTPTGNVIVTSTPGSAVCTADLVAGAGSCALILDSPATYTLTASYSGDEQFAPSISLEEQHTVIPIEQVKIFLPLIIR